MEFINREQERKLEINFQGIRRHATFSGEPSLMREKMSK